jgi:HD superfamily phosphohydrolase
MKVKKIINDPVYGFISIKSKLLLKIIDHPYFQRLRRIKQLGLTDFVYPGAHHTRFHHALGAMHLMDITLNTLKAKGHKISKQEYIASLAAILLHDVGHGPFSHALESTILKGIHHEKISLLLMEELNKALDGKLSLAISIFSDTYPRRFFHQLVSSQLDMDRLDYLQRDVYFTGVMEGKIGFDRIIRMLDIVDDKIVVEEKGIYSIENFLNARRLMYWQVYLHKTTVSTEQMLIKLILRARALALKGEEIYTTPALSHFLKTDVQWADFGIDSDALQKFAQLDDYDIWACVKVWANHTDKVLRVLSGMFLNRELFKTILSNEPASEADIQQISNNITERFGVTAEDAKFLFGYGVISNAGYVSNAENILIKLKTGSVQDVAQASDLPNIKALCQVVKKYYLCYPRE